ncbi:MAG: alpha/beta fold hydrolase, partial [Phormidesmis sp.]
MIRPASKATDPLLMASGLAVIAFAFAYGGTCLALYHLQTKLIFRPLPQIFNTPADAGLAYEDVWIPVDGGRAGKLHGWWLPCLGSDRVLLFCHGNYGNISHNLARIRYHHSLGFSVLAFDYRGYGQSIGASASSGQTDFPSEASTYADAEAAWHYLTR